MRQSIWFPSKVSWRNSAILIAFLLLYRLLLKLLFFVADPVAYPGFAFLMVLASLPFMSWLLMWYLHAVTWLQTPNRSPFQWEMGKAQKDESAFAFWSILGSYFVTRQSLVLQLVLIAYLYQWRLVVQMNRETKESKKAKVEAKRKPKTQKSKPLNFVEDPEQKPRSKPKSKPKAPPATEQIADAGRRQRDLNRKLKDVERQMKEAERLMDERDNK